MNNITSVSETSQAAVSPVEDLARKPSQTKRSLVIKSCKWAAIAAVGITIVAVLALQDDVRTLTSLRRVQGTNTFVMDYYASYHMDEIRDRGMDVHNIEDSCLAAYFPDFVVPIARGFKRSFLTQEIKTL